MTLVLEAVARNASCNAEVDLVDAGGGAGYVKVYTAGAVELVKINLAATAFGNAAAGIATAAGLPKSGVASATGTATNYKVFDFANAQLWAGSVTTGGGGGDMTLNTVSIVAANTVSITAWTHTVPAS